MSWTSSLTRLRRLLSGSSRGSARPARPASRRPSLETLEDRLAPAVLTGASFTEQPSNPPPAQTSDRSGPTVVGSGVGGAATGGTHTTGSAVKTTTTTGTVNLAATHPAAATSYSPVNGVLFGPNGPSYLDVQQGDVGDCWLESSLAEVAARDPNDIKSMFTYNGTAVENGATVGVYTVRLYSNSGSPYYATVDTELPSGGGYYDHPVGGSGAINGSSQPVLWVALAEKAYAEANGAGAVTTSHPGQDSYAALNSGDPQWALHAITGKPASDYSINPSNAAAAWNSGKLVVMCTNQPSSSYIVPDHCYAMVGYTASSTQPFKVFNPWGTQSNGWAPYETNKIYGQFTANSTFISQNFAWMSFGVGKGVGEGATQGNQTVASNR